MSNRIDLLTPIGRLVLGSLYDAQTTDALGNPLVNKRGEPRVKYYFGLAVPKKNESHWSQTEWGQKIVGIAQLSFPQGQFNQATFAWKINDGDSIIPNKAGGIPANKPGHPGYWVLNFSNQTPLKIYNCDGTKQLLEPKFVNLGDYIQVFGSVRGNDSAQQPGVYLNHNLVAFHGYGERILLGPDPKTVGFGGVLPPGASQTPLPTGFNPSISTPAHTTFSLPINTTPASPALVPPPPPHPGILSPPLIADKILTAKAQGASYDQLIANGWTDLTLIQHGLLQP